MEKLLEGGWTCSQYRDLQREKKTTTVELSINNTSHAKHKHSPYNMAKKVPKNIDCIYVIAFVLFVVSSYAKRHGCKNPCEK